jgi:hypothetical protein
VASRKSRISPCRLIIAALFTFLRAPPMSRHETNDGSPTLEGKAEQVVQQYAPTDTNARHTHEPLVTSRRNTQCRPASAAYDADNASSQGGLRAGHQLCPMEAR